MLYKHISPNVHSMVPFQEKIFYSLVGMKSKVIPRHPIHPQVIKNYKITLNYKTFSIFNKNIQSQVVTF